MGSSEVVLERHSRGQTSRQGEADDSACGFVRELCARRCRQDTSVKNSSYLKPETFRYKRNKVYTKSVCRRDLFKPQLVGHQPGRAITDYSTSAICCKTRVSHCEAGRRCILLRSEHRGLFEEVAAKGTAVIPDHHK